MLRFQPLHFLHFLFLNHLMLINVTLQRLSRGLSTVKHYNFIAQGNLIPASRLLSSNQKLDQMITGTNTASDFQALENGNEQMVKKNDSIRLKTPLHINLLNKNLTIPWKKALGMVLAATTHSVLTQENLTVFNVDDGIVNHHNSTQFLTYCNFPKTMPSAKYSLLPVILMTKELAEFFSKVLMELTVFTINWETVSFSIWKEKDFSIQFFFTSKFTYVRTSLFLKYPNIAPWWGVEKANVAANLNDQIVAGKLILLV